MGGTGIVAAFLLGLAVAPWLEPSAWTALPALGAAGAWLVLRRTPASPWLLATFLLLLGPALSHLALLPPRHPDHLLAHAGEQPLRIEGQVLELARRADGTAVIDLAADRLREAGGARPVRGRVRLQVEQGEPPCLPGDRILVRTRLRPPRLYGTPGEFDYPAYLARRGIFLTGWIEEADAVVRLAAPRPASPAAWIGAWRRTAAARIDRALPADRAALVRALALGDKTGLGEERRDLLARSGLAHLFAISGLHLGLLGLFGYRLLLPLYRRSERLLLWHPPSRVLPLALLPLLTVYLVLTGGALATRRALLMLLLGLLLALASRRTGPWRLLGTAAFLLLLFDPLAIREAGLQLSFAALAGILAATLPRRRWLAGRPWPLRWLPGAALVTWGATLATFPLVLHHFHLLAPAGLLLNLPAVPAVGFAALPAALAGLFLAPFWPAAAELAFRACGAILAGILDLAALATAWPPLAGWTLYPDPLRLLGCALLAAALLGWSPRASLRLPLVLLALGACLWLLPLPGPAELTLTPLSVGQGDATLVSFPGGRHYLVDGGGSYREGVDVGRRLVAPALGRLGVRRLEGVILTHDHPDHRQGLEEVLRAFAVGTFYSGLSPGEMPDSLRRALAVRGTPLRTMTPGWHRLPARSGERLELFVPSQAEPSVNDRSLVVFVSRNGRGALLPGDLEEKGVRRLLAALPEGLGADLLKLPHHGSRHSAPELLLQRLRPDAAFASSGFRNPHRLPHPEVCARLAEAGIPLRRTDLEGTLRFTAEAPGWRSSRWERGLFR